MMKTKTQKNKDKFLVELQKQINNRQENKIIIEDLNGRWGKALRVEGVILLYFPKQSQLCFLDRMDCIKVAFDSAIINANQ